MQGIYFLLCFIAVAIVLRWCMMADGTPGAEFKGLLAIKKDPQPEVARQEARHGRFER